MNAWVAFRSPNVGSQRPPGGERATKTLGTERLKTASTAGSDTSTTSRALGQELGRDAFLQLLVLEMQHQNPLEPLSNSEMLSQLAQFSSLEQMNNLNDSFADLSGNIDQLNFISATGLLGRHISGIDMAGQPREGVVEQVHLDGSVVYLTVDGALMSMAGVIGIGVGEDQPDPVVVDDGEKRAATAPLEKAFGRTGKLNLRGRLDALLQKGV